MRIVIVGGGFSGLMSAFLLERMLGPETEILILEASERLGGRIKTDKMNSNDAYYDSGAAEFYEITGGYSMRALTEFLGLETRDMIATPTFCVGDKLLKSETDFRKHLGQPGFESLSRFWDRVTSERTIDEYASAGHPKDNRHPWFKQPFSKTLDLIEDPKARAFTEIQVHSDLATEPELTHGLFGADNLLIDHPHYCQMFSLIGGNGQLIKALSDRVSGEVLLNTPVQRVVALDDGSYDVFFGSSHIRRINAQYVLATPPPLGLRDISWQPAPLQEVIQGHINHHNHPTTYVRTTLMTTEASWNENLPEDYFVCDKLGGYTAYDKSIRSGADTVPILSVLVGGQDAAELAAASDDEVFEAVLESLPPAAGLEGDMVREYRVDRWTREMGVSRLPGGTHLLPIDRRHAPSSEYAGVYLLGDYLYDATINGALESCLYVARSICGKVLGPSAESATASLESSPFLQTVERPDATIVSPGQYLPFLKHYVE